MIILNILPVMKNNPIAIIFLIGLMLCIFAAMILERKHSNAVILSCLFSILFLISLAAIAICGKAMIPSGRERYEVYVEDPAALEGYKVVDKRGLIYVIEEIENADT